MQKPTRLQGQVDELGYRRDSEAGSQVPDFSHTLDFQPSPYQLHIPSQRLITFLSDSRHAQTCSLSTFLFYFYLTFKRIILLYLTPKKKRFGVPPFSLLPLVYTGSHAMTFLPIRGNGCWGDETFCTDKQRCPRSLLLVIRAFSGLSGEWASLKCHLALALCNLDCQK